MIEEFNARVWCNKAHVCGFEKDTMTKNHFTMTYEISAHSSKIKENAHVFPDVFRPYDFDTL